MSDREKYIKIISDHFSIWEVRLQNLSSLNLYDANSFSEYSIAELLNLIFGYKLENLNKLKINGFQTINTEKLSNLNGAALEELNKSGFLQAAYFIVSSMSNIRKLIDLKNRKLLTGDNLT